MPSLRSVVLKPITRINPKKMPGAALGHAALVVGVLAALCGAPVGVARADTFDYCPAGTSPHFALGFANLQAEVGEVMGDPVECEHTNPENGDSLQQTTTGLSFYRHSTNTPTFTNGVDHWALTADGLVTWSGDSIDPPNVVPPAAPAIPSVAADTPGPVVPAPQVAPATAGPPVVVAAPPAPSAAAAAPPAARSVPTPAPVATTPVVTEADVAASVAPSIVEIATQDGTGSGVAIAGGILTSEHVVSGASRIEVLTADGRRAVAQVQRSNSHSDLALLRTDLRLHALELEPASRQRQGDPLLVLGYPRASALGLGGPPTVTRGLLSAVRQIGDITLLQTDAAVNPGNSGGAAVNMQGKLVGVVSFGIRDSEGLNFAIAAETIQGFLNGPDTIAHPPQAIFHGDPASIAVAASDLGSGWRKISDDSKGGSDGLYSAVFAHGPVGKEDAARLIIIAVLPDAQAAQSLWQDTFGKPTPGYRAVPVAPIGEASLAETNADGVVVRSRVKNVILMAAGSPSGSPPRADDVARLVQQMADRVNRHLS